MFSPKAVGRSGLLIVTVFYPGSPGYTHFEEAPASAGRAERRGTRAES